jgi:DNA-binding NtrC family response regulator
MIDPARVLVVDDDEHIRGWLSDLLEANRYGVVAAADGGQAVGLLRSGEFDAVITDLMLPGADGIEVVRAARSRPDAPEAIVVTAFGSIESAVEAVRAGAFDYLTKPLSSQKLLVVLERALERRSLKREVDLLRREAGDRRGTAGVVAVSEAMRRVMALADAVAASDAPVLLQGESGTGKELVARAIHQRGPRAARPFVAVNCAALPEPLLESELFGHVRGAFTGAHVEKRGLFEEADGGTLLLDEIGDMSHPLQAKLLRVLQEREVRRVGATATKRVDVRAIASTHRDLSVLIADGKFREDLYYRLAVIPVVVPPLRERREDVVPLVQHFTSIHARRAGAGVRSFSAEALALMMAYDWPGNVRELGNVVERALTLIVSPVISAAEFAPVFALGRAAGPAQPARAPDERGAILAALEASGWNHTKAAESLDIARNTLWRRMKQYDITRPG